MVVDLPSPHSMALRNHELRKLPPSSLFNHANAPALTQLHLAVMDRIVEDYPPTPLTPSTTEDQKSLSPSGKSQTPKMLPSSHSARGTSTVDTVSSTGLSSGTTWHDETRDFSMTIVRATLRAPDERPGELVRNYNWYSEAVPVDGILPPGVPMSSTEICAYYPHHVRWQGVMVRLAQNDYRGPDILGMQAIFRGAPQDYMNPPVTNQIQRDTVRYWIPEFKTTGYKGNGDSNLYTDHLKPGAYLEKKLKGYTVPSFDDLLYGLQHLPSGRDAGGLTHCLAWYHDMCSTFTPKLQLNVLHTQALIRALQQPLKPASSQNLDKLALEEWRDVGTLEKATIRDVKHGYQHKKKSIKSTKQFPRTQAMFNIRKDSIDLRMHIHLSIRHILSFPFLALCGIMGKALQMGIDKAEGKRAARKSLTAPPTEAEKEKNKCKDTLHQTPKRPRQADVIDEKLSVHTPKRQRTLQHNRTALAVRAPKRPTVSPITPRTSRLDNSATQSYVRPTKLELSLSKRDSD